jgi:hypothetical protein
MQLDNYTVRARAACEKPHVAHHTAATTLLLLGVPERAVMDGMGAGNTLSARPRESLTVLSDYVWPAIDAGALSSMRLEMRRLGRRDRGSRLE